MSSSSSPSSAPQVMNQDGRTSAIRDKILTIDVQPGWRQGTRITFEKEGDQVTAAGVMFWAARSSQISRWCPVRCCREATESSGADECCCAQEDSKKNNNKTKSPFCLYFSFCLTFSLG